MSRPTRTIVICSLLLIALGFATALHLKTQSQVQVPPGLRAQRDTWTPQLADEVIKAAENTVYTEEFKREMMHSGKYRTRDIYPRMSPEVEKVFEEWKKTHPRKP